MVKNVQTEECAITKHLQAQLQESKQQIYGLTYYDTLTKLPNRKKLIDLFNSYSDESDRTEGAIFLVDVDRFHSINELYGRETGDKLLIQIAHRLKTLFGKKDTVFRNSEDEFIVRLQDLPFYQIEKVGKDILDMLSSYFSVGSKTFYITASIGISHFPATGQTIQQLLNQAEIAMYKVKSIGKNNFQVFLPTDARVVERKSRIEFDLQKALNERQLYLLYQPKIELETGKLIGVEALLRWEHSELGNISPGEFIPIAEESGIIKDIGYWVIYEAIRQTKEWQVQGYEISTAVNVSAVQFNDRHFVTRVLDVLNTLDLNPWHLIVEITESVVKDFKYAQSIITELKNNHIRIAIDDFGTGYSSLSVLKDTYIDAVKIDKSFIDDVPKDSVSSNLVSTMIQMGKDMNFDIIAEGIETLEQSSYLMENDCKYGQGYLFSKPVMPDEIIKYIDKCKIKNK